MAVLEIGIQTKNVISDANPLEGFELLRRSGFTCCDFSLNSYLKNTTLYCFELNGFYNKSDSELEEFFMPHKEAAAKTGIRINQMHMPYPNYVPHGADEFNRYLKEVVAVKSMKICKFFECPYIVMHGFKLARILGSEEAEWERTKEFIEYIAPLAKEYGITICIENLYVNYGRRIVEGPCCNARKACMRIDSINEKYGAEVLGFCFDTGHAGLVRLDIEDFITTLGDRLKVLHIHDNDGVSDLHQIPFTFAKGMKEKLVTTDWDGFINGLRKIKFNKVLNFETAPGLDAFPDELKPKAVSFIADIGRYFLEQIYKI